ncbi:MAG: agmatinase [Oscillospiraceae bacterium]|nr:agmatinase [Oscillospiraceae bacterium]
MLPEIKSFIGCESSFEEAAAVIFGAPYDCTASYRPGARFAPSAIRNESYGIETYSHYQDKDLSDISVFDSGDIELPFGDPVPVIEAIRERTAEILAADKLPVMLGGEHLVTLGAFKAVCEHFADKYGSDVYVIQFDAHCDLRRDYLGQQLSHASVMRLCHDIAGDGHIYQFGIRSGERSEFEFAKKHTKMYPAAVSGVSFEKLPEAIEELRGKNVYLTIDTDVLDPAFFPGTGTPEAGGADFGQLLSAIIMIGKELNIVGADINELSPPCDQSGASTALVCKLTRELLLALL